ncbi:uncharacterized protein [Parasteatoda tepidariorum]|uniref:uncharacterized protein n=1 Tax=Parasteatoda tepidariorum TaxID=114398 RepID=UPI0039BD6C71
MISLGKAKTINNTITSNHASFNTVDYQLDKFWNSGEISETKLILLKKYNMNISFEKTFYRASTGRFIIKFPLRESSDQFGSTGDIAVHRLQQIKRRFEKNQPLSQQNHKFMNDYPKLDRMELIPENKIDVPAKPSFCLPHHPVPLRSGDKFRVLFDGSEKPSSDISLNDKFMIGPQLQLDITSNLECTK